MALIHTLEHHPRDRCRVHDSINARYHVFEDDGMKFLQINTYGRAERDHPDVSSQTVQLSRESAQQLYDVLRETFDLQ